MSTVKLYFHLRSKYSFVGKLSHFKDTEVQQRKLLYEDCSPESMAQFRFCLLGRQDPLNGQVREMKYSTLLLDDEWYPHLARVQKVVQLLIVDFEKRDTNRNGCRVDRIEDAVNRLRDDARNFRFPKHCVSLAGASLTVSQNTSMGSIIDELRDNWGDCAQVNRLLETAKLVTTILREKICR